jgi:transcriptional regulator with XRE-family HTH domain
VSDLGPAQWKSLGDRLLRARLRRGWTRPDFATHLGRPVGTVQQWELGNHRPQRRALHELATLLAIPYTELAALAGYAVTDE